MLIFLYKLQHTAVYCLHFVPPENIKRSIRNSFKMDFNVSIQLIFLCVVNIIFAFSGMILNTLVIACFWKSSQLRKKLCHFMIMVLSCIDLVSVVVNNPGMLFYLVSWLTEDYDLLPKIKTYFKYSDKLYGSSLLALLLMNIERYLGAYYPIFHHTSVTRRRWLALLAILLILHAASSVISTNGIIISEAIHVAIYIIVIFPLFVFLNFKLFKISRKIRRQNAISPGNRTTVNLKSISTCFFAVGCIGLLSIPSGVYIVFNINPENDWTSKAMLTYIWATTIYSMNSTFNSLIFFWKNKILCTEGIKILKTVKDRLLGF